MNNVNPAQHFVPSPDVVTSIVIPTIVFCIGMVIAMLIGINKSKQWELDKIVEIRRTRRVIQRITARLREKNFTTIQKARNMRKRAVAAKKSSSIATTSHDSNNNNNSNNNTIADINSNKIPSCAKSLLIQHAHVALPIERIAPPPPTYSTLSNYLPGNSPPPTYEDSLLDQLYVECLPFGTEADEPELERRRSSKCSNNRRKSSSSTSSKRFSKK